MSDSPTSMAQPFRSFPLGDAALMVELGREIDPAVSDRVIAYAEAIHARRWDGVLDVVPTYCSVTIHVDPLVLDVGTLMDRLRQISPADSAQKKSSGRHHRIPVLYGGEFGPDLEDVAAFANLPVAEAIRLHASILYRVYMIGFSPGFPYLGSVPAPLAMPRLATPRTTVPAGSVGIAGSQTGIYPTATPGGWRIIGRTPRQLYRPNNATPFLLSPGDFVQFQPVDPREYDRLCREKHADPD
jgi:inhibitor of KinA